MSFSQWEKVTLGDVSNIQTGPFGSQLHASDYVDEGIPSIMPQNIGDNRIHEEGIARIKHEDAERLSKYLVTQGDIVYSRRGDVEKRALIRQHEEGWLCGTGCLRVRVDQRKIDPSFASFQLGHPPTRAWIVQHAHGATMPNLNTSILSQVPFSYPEYKEQRLIAETLSCLDDKIELNNLMNKKLEEMAQAIFKSWFVDFEPFQECESEDSELGKIPKGWKVVELGDISKFTKGKKPKELMETRSSDSLAQYLTIDALNGGISIFADVEKMVLANTYDILMVMDGASSGTVYFGLNGVVGSTIAKFIVNNELVKEVVYQYLKANESEIKSHNTGSAIPHTDKGYVSRCKIAIPQDEELREISKSLKELRGMIIENRLQSKKLVDIRDSLLPKLMSGEIRIPVDEVQ